MADYQYVVETGVIVPDTATLQDTVNAEFREAFGADLVLTPDTPQGVLATAETLARDAVVRNNAAVANQINPDLAGGVFLDALWALTGGSRVRATRSLITGVILTGAPNTIIPAGSTASVGPSGPIFQTTGTVQLSIAGTATAIFQAVDTGAIPAPAGDLNTIVSGVLGWETVSNPDPAELGKAEETDTAARRRRRSTLALQTVALPEAIVSGVFAVDGVRSVLFRENVTDAIITIDTVDLAPHSVYVAVEGGTDLDVATELLHRKSLGAGWNGTTVVPVLEPISGQTYEVKFQRPDPLQVYAKVTVKQGTEIADPATLVRNAILAYANGEVEGEDGFIIGGDVTPWELAGAVNIGSPGLFVLGVEIGLDPLTLSTANIPINIDQIPQIFDGNIAVVIVP